VAAEEFLNAVRSIVRRLASWAAALDFFALAIFFALSGHLLLALLLNGISAAGVDFGAIDQSHRLAPILQFLLFAIETALIVAAIARSGVNRAKTYIGVAALFWAIAMLMITFVSAQCDLYGACL